MDNPQYIAQLVLKQLKGELDNEGTVALNDWINRSEANQILYQQLTTPEALQSDLQDFYQSKANILKKIEGTIIVPKIVPMWKKMIAAASVILILSTYFLIFNKKIAQPNTAQIAADIKAPQINRAMITLDNGQILYLDSIANGSVITKGSIKIIKTADGEVVYSGNTNKIAFNTLSNPKGSKVINMTLSDGSLVWLNAGSSITYPVAFSAKVRKVSIIGEAYFEVKHDDTKPFIVSKGETSVTVLGTHFNVNAYNDESEIKVTLMEGSVKVNNTILKPGQQAQVSSVIKVVNDVDLDQVIAWKNGLFNFNKTELGEIMRQLEKWYDVEVEYPEGKPIVTLTGIINRNINAVNALEMLKISGVHFTIEGKKIIIKP